MEEKLIARIQLLKSRTDKENGRIIKKLERQLRNLRAKEQ